MRPWLGNNRYSTGPMARSDLPLYAEGGMESSSSPREKQRGWYRVETMRVLVPCPLCWLHQGRK